MSFYIKRRYEELLSHERGTVHKDWGGKITICLVFPNRYRVGMSNLGFQFIYALLNAHPDVVCERAFFPEKDLLEEHLRTQTPLLSLESRRPLNQFHVVAFSLPFENDYPNLLEILHLGRVPVLSSQRGPRDPLVVAGGAAIAMNPEPLAPFLDCVLIGEGEELVEEFLEGLRRSWDSPREDLLKELALIPGIYVPSLYEPRWGTDGTLQEIRPLDTGVPERVPRRWLQDLRTSTLISSPLLTPEAEFGETVLIEVGRGCPYRCRFCAVRTLYDPFRPRPLEALERAAEEGLGQTGKVGLLGAAVASHPQFEELCRHILSEGGSFSVASLRADRVTSEVARALAEAGQLQATLAPEAGSEALRQRIAKGLLDEEILEAVRNLAEGGITTLKLYFMVGLPGGGEEVKEIAALVRRIRHQMTVALKGRRREELIVSVNPFVPKPWTPLQWHPYEGVKRLRQKMKALKRELQRVPNCRLLHDLPKWGYFQALFSLGDRRVGLSLYRGWREGDWPRYLRTAPFNPDFWVMRPKGRDERFPFEVVDIGVERQFLWEEYQRAMSP